MPRTKSFNEASVLEKAVQVFWSKGYNGTSAQDLVDELCISRSSLYDTYGDKRSLFIKALQHIRSTLSKQLIDMINRSENIEETLRQIFEIIVKDALGDKLFRGCFMVNTTIELAPHDKDIAAIIRQNMKDIENALCIAIERGQKEGVFSERQSALSLARFVSNSVSGLRVAAKLGGDKSVYDDIVNVTLSVLNL